MKIRLLGHPRITGHDGEDCPVRGQQAWAVLARVLLSDRPLPRRRIAAELFPETDDPLGALRWCLAALRRALGAETMQGDPVEARLPAGAIVDVLSVGQPGFDYAAADTLLDGLDPAGGSDFATWLLVERERIAGLVDAELRQDTIQALARSDNATALALAGLAARRRPLDEGAHVLLVRALVADGRHKAAEDHIAATRATFIAELGEPPSPALQSAARPTISSPPPGVSPAAMIESLIQSGLAALSAGAADAGLDNLRRAGAEAERVGDRILQARALCELGTALIHTVRGFDDEGMIHLRQAAEIARETGEAPTLCRALQEMGYSEALAGRRPSAQRLLGEALEVCTNDGERAGAHGLIGFNLVDWGRHEDGLAHYDCALDFARGAGNRRREVWSLGLGGWGQMLAGNHELAEQWLSEALRLTDELRWVAFRPWPAAVLAETRLLSADRPARIRASLEETFALSCQLGDPCWQAAAARVIALTHETDGDLDAAAGWLAAATERCLSVTDSYAALHVAIMADRLRFVRERGDAAAAEHIARELLALAARTHADSYLAPAMAAMTQRGSPFSAAAPWPKLAK